MKQNKKWIIPIILLCCYAALIALGIQITGLVWELPTYILTVSLIQILFLLFGKKLPTGFGQATSVLLDIFKLLLPGIVFATIALVQVFLLGMGLAFKWYDVLFVLLFFVLFALETKTVNKLKLVKE